MVREEASAHGEQLRIGPEVGETIGGLEDQLAVVARVAGNRAEALEREHGVPGYSGPAGSPARILAMADRSVKRATFWGTQMSARRARMVASAEIVTSARLAGGPGAAFVRVGRVGPEGCEHVVE